MDKEPLIDYDDLEFPNEDERDYTAYYKGELFTGIAYEKHKNNYFEYAYLNGLEHGRSYGYNVNTEEIVQDENYIRGQKHEKCFNKNDYKRFESHEFYNEGILLRQKYLNFEGILIKEYDKSKDIELEYYDDGTLYKERKITKENVLETYFLGNRNEWICRKSGYNTNKKQYNFEFNEELIINRVDVLESRWHWFPISWFIPYLIDRDRNKAFEFLKILINHRDEYFKGEAVDFLGELGIEEGIELLRKELKNPNKPSIEHRFDYGGHMNSFTIGKRAKIAIGKLRAKNSFWNRIFRKN